MSKHIIWGIIALIFFLGGVDSLKENQNIGISMILLALGIIGIIVFIVYKRSKKSEFTKEQVLQMKELVNKELGKIRERKQERIDDAVNRGESISTEKLLEILDELKTSYKGNNPEEFFAMIEKNKKDFREKYGPTIPVDVAYKIAEGLEELP